METKNKKKLRTIREKKTLHFLGPGQFGARGHVPQFDGAIGRPRCKKRAFAADKDMFSERSLSETANNNNTTLGLLLNSGSSDINLKARVQTEEV